MGSNQRNTVLESGKLVHAAWFRSYGVFIAGEANEERPTAVLRRGAESAQFALIESAAAQTVCCTRNSTPSFACVARSHSRYSSQVPVSGT